VRISKEDEAKLADGFARAYKSLVDFRKVFMTKDDAEEFTSPEYHHAWSDILLHSSDNYAIEGFRQSGKTSIVSGAFPLYCLRFPSAHRNYIVIIKANATQAEKRLKDIQNEFFENELINSGSKKPVESSSQCLLVDVYSPKERRYIRVRIEAYGRGASVRGLNAREGRPKIILLDDIQDVGDMNSQTTLEQDFEWYDSDVRYLGVKSRIFFIANNLGKKCLIERIFENADAFGYKTMKVPVCDAEFTKSAWPDLISIEQIKQEKENSLQVGTLATWYRERMCEAVSDEMRVFHENTFQYYPYVNRGKMSADMNVFIRVDPAVGLKQANDPTVFLVGGFNADSNIFLLDGCHGNWTTKEKLDRLFSLCGRWNPINVGVENSKEGQLFIQAVRSEMPKRNVFFKIEEVTHGSKQKETRILMLEPRFTERTVWFPDGRYDWLDELKEQLLGFTREGAKTLHDDYIDTLAYFLQKTYKPSGKEVKKEFNVNRNSIGTTRVV